MVRTLIVGAVALLLIVGITLAAFGAGWSALGVIVSIVVRVTVVSIPVGALAQALVRRPLPVWAALFLGLVALLAQSLLLGSPSRLPLTPVEAVLYLAIAVLSAALVDAGAGVVRVYWTRRSRDEKSGAGSRA